jgi:hypothetical protein
MRHRHLVPATLFSLALTTAATTQDPAPTVRIEPERPQGIEELIAKVRIAHRPASTDGDQQPIDQFHATLRVTPVRRDADNVEVDLDASFLAPQLLRYKVEDASATLERGQDEEGCWARTDDRVLKLQGKDFATERDEVRKHVRLARQLLGFLDPGSVFETMTIVAPPQTAQLRVARDETIETRVFDGTVDSFPLFAPPEGGDPAPPAKLTVWIDAATHRLAGVLVQPLDDEGKPSTVGEFFLLKDYTERQGAILPLRLLIYQVARGRKFPEAEIEIRAIDLSPGLTPDRMRRPEP